MEQVSRQQTLRKGRGGETHFYKRRGVKEIKDKFLKTMQRCTASPGERQKNSIKLS